MSAFGCISEFPTLTEWLQFGAPAPQLGALNFVDPAVLWCELAPFPRTRKWLLRSKCWTNPATDWVTPSDSWAWLQADRPPPQLDLLSPEKGACGAVLPRVSLKWLSASLCSCSAVLWVGVCSPPCAICTLEKNCQSVRFYFPSSCSCSWRIEEGKGHGDRVERGGGGAFPSWSLLKSGQWEGTLRRTHVPSQQPARWGLAGSAFKGHMLL